MKNRFKTKPYIQYSNCFEDAETLLKCFPRGAKSVLSIASAGDNSLALLTKDIDSITVFDKNPAQLILTKLKFAAFRHLSYRETLALLGVGKGDIRAAYSKLEPHLDGETREFFAVNSDLIFKIGLIHSGRFEYYFQIFKRRILPLTQSKRNVEAFMSLTDVSAQRPFYCGKIDNRRWRFVIKRFFGERTLARLGREKSYFAFAGGDLPTKIMERFFVCIDHVLNRENPFLQYAVLNRFDCLPLYLREENFASIKQNAHKAVFVHGDVRSVCESGGAFDFFNLSDIFEYMSGEETLENEKMLAGRANVGAVAVFWNMMVDRQFSTEHFSLVDTAELFKRDKAYFYQALRVYRKGEQGNV